MTSAVPTYQDLINHGAAQLYDTSDTPRIDAEVLLQHILDKGMAWLIAHGDTLANAEHIRHYFQLLERRVQGQPIAYLIGYRDFWTLRLHVNTSVLIPRPDTETLVEHALEALPINKPLNILDLGTGSGAIALALAKERPKAQVLATDAMANALAVATRNAESNSITNVRFLQSDWCTRVPNQPRFDLIASNPPYVDQHDSHLQQGDLRFEPNTALIAADNGLSDLKRIVFQARNHLVANGCLILEHGYNQAEQVAQLLEGHGYHDVSLHTDINQLPRCTSARFG